MNIEKIKSKVNTPYTWIKEGLIWGIFMFVFVGMIMPKFFGDPLNQTTMMKSAIQWLIGGLIYGLVTVKLLWPFLIRRTEKKEAAERIKQ